MSFPRSMVMVLTVFLVIYSNFYLIVTGLILYRIGSISVAEAISVLRAGLWPSLTVAIVVGIITYAHSRRRNKR